MINGTISIDYENCMEQARRLDQFAEDCEREARSAQSTSGDIADRWKGNAGVAMSEKYKIWGNEQLAIADEMHSVAAQIRSTAESIKQADEEAAARIRAEQMAVAGAAVVGSAEAGSAATALGAQAAAGQEAAGWIGKAVSFLRRR